MSKRLTTIALLAVSFALSATAATAATASHVVTADGGGGSSVVAGDSNTHWG